MESYSVIGMMSGTSLDGMDLAYVEFYRKKGNWSFTLGPYQSKAYSKKWKNRLSNLMDSSASDFVKSHVEFGHLIGKKIHEFIAEHQLKVDLIGAHGHTVFHQPELGFTSQIGDGSAIVVETAVDVVCDFRSMDVARGGQGAPLVPIGDALLFGEYDARINLGGFSNVSIGEIDNLQAFDICPVNIVLNKLSLQIGLEYDKNGEIARGGQVIESMLVQLNQLDFYKKAGSKSLGAEWVVQEVWPLFDASQSWQDLLRTFTEHIAIQISKILNQTCSDSNLVLFTGGGVFNDFLMERIKELTNAKIEIPSTDIVEMKEAIVFAFLGLLRYLGEENILASYSDAQKNSISGALYLS